MRLWQVAALAILLLGSVAITTGTLVWYRTNQSHNESQSRANASQIAVATRKTLDGYADQIAGTGALFSQPSQIGHAEFHSYLKSLDVYDRYPGLYGLGFVSKVPAADLPAFVAQANADGLPDFTVSPPGARATYCVSSYVDVNELSSPVPLAGYDLCTVPQLAPVLDEVGRTGAEKAVPESLLGPAPAFAGNFVLITPVYQGTPKDATERGVELVLSLIHI